MTQGENHGIIWLYQKRSFLTYLFGQKNFLMPKARSFPILFPCFIAGKERKRDFSSATKSELSFAKSRGNDRFFKKDAIRIRKIEKNQG